MKRKFNLFQPDKRRLWFGLSLFITGVGLLGWFTHWTAPVAVFLMIWGNNLDD